MALEKDNNEYNKVYESLVHEDKDIVGMLAYAIYKKQKQETIKEHRLRTGVRPRDNDLKSFHALATQKTQLEMYRKQATELTQSLANSILLSKKKDIKDIIDGHLANKKDFWSFMYGVSQSLVANLIWLILIGILAIVLWSQEHGPFETLKSIINNY